MFVSVTNGEGAVRLRWLLTGSLALNLLFVGAAGAVAFRYSSAGVPLATVARIDHDPMNRLNRLAASLPPNDAQLLRAQLRADEIKVAAAQADVRLTQEAVRNSLRAEPFDTATFNAAMAANHAAHEKFDKVLHDTIGTAAAKMSVVGRNKLADWPPPHERQQHSAG